MAEKFLLQMVYLSMLLVHVNISIYMKRQRNKKYVW